MKIDIIHYKVVGFIIFLIFLIYIINIFNKEEFKNDVPKIKIKQFKPLSKLYDIDDMCKCSGNLNWKCFWRKEYSNSEVKYNENNLNIFEPLLYDGIHKV